MIKIALSQANVKLKLAAARNKFSKVFWAEQLKMFVERETIWKKLIEVDLKTNKKSRAIIFSRLPRD